MRRARAIVSIPSGRRTKWMVLVLWVAILAVAGPLAGKLMGAEKNDAQAWLPAQAESTRVLALQSQFLSPNVFPAVVVYDRPGGLTAADRAKATADAGRFRSVAGVVPGQVQGPFTARDGQAIQTVVPVDLGTGGWDKAGPAVDSLRQAVTHAEQAQTASRSRDQIDRLEAQHLLNQSHDAVVEALTARGFAVILNNHTVKSRWCCGVNDLNERWNESQTDAEWADAWLFMVRRYKDNKRVVGADLYNEVRVVSPSNSWFSQGPHRSAVVLWTILIGGWAMTSTGSPPVSGLGTVYSPKQILIC